MFFDDCTVGSDALDAVKENDIEVVKVLGDESDLPEALFPELALTRIQTLKFVLLSQDWSNPRKDVLRRRVAATVAFCWLSKRLILIQTRVSRVQALRRGCPHSVLT